jgi:hypothetical protein
MTAPQPDAAYGPICRHCGRKPRNRPRGLCWHCYYTPSISARYPTTSRYRPPPHSAEEAVAALAQLHRDETDRIIDGLKAAAVGIDAEDQSELLRLVGAVRALLGAGKLDRAANLLCNLADREAAPTARLFLALSPQRILAV